MFFLLFKVIFFFNVFPKAGTDYAGSDLRAPSVTTAEECSCECHKDGECNAWTFKGTEGPCYLKTSITNENLQHAISGSKTC